ncbi:MAG: TonB family protein [Cyclobacteriaceae bacterium]|nr:TonB family protein [Cyclobacteriaceae bacterium]
MTDPKDDIAKYLSGELTPSEMHALEKRALHDPFLGDALEGTARIKPEDLESDLKKLHAALGERVLGKAGKTISIWMWPARIAAGLLIIVIATFVIIKLTGNTGSEELAVNNEAPSSQEEDKNVLSPSADTLEENKNLLSLAKPEEPPSLSEPKPQNQYEAADNVQSTASQPFHEVEGQGAEATKSEEDNTRAEIEAEEKIAHAVPTETTLQPAPKKSATKELSTRARASDQKAAGAPVDRAETDESGGSRIIKGRVKSENGTGLAGVNIVIKGTNVGTMTDVSGYYQISVGEQIPTLVFSCIGFMRTEITAGSEDQTNVQLNQDVSQRSEVVAGYGAERKADDSSISNLEFASPEGGQSAYKAYLENNLRYPAQALEKNIEGEVTIEFTVEPTGQLTAFKVIQGLGYGCDEEVIRLVQEGPRWRPTKRNTDLLRDIVKVRMKFTYPKK